MPFWLALLATGLVGAMLAGSPTRAVNGVKNCAMRGATSNMGADGVVGRLVR